MEKYKWSSNGRFIGIIRLSAKGTDGVMKPEGCAFAVENCLLYCPRRCSANYTDRGGEWRGCIAATSYCYMLSVIR